MHHYMVAIRQLHMCTIPYITIHYNIILYHTIQYNTATNTVTNIVTNTVTNTVTSSSSYFLLAPVQYPQRVT